MRTATLLLALHLLGGAVVASEVSVSDGPGAPRVTVRTQSALATDLLEEIARRTGRMCLRAEDVPDSDPLTSIDLRDRALDEVVEILAGSAGLVATIRTDSISLTREPVVGDARELRVRALAAHARSVLAYPKRSEVITTRVAMARIHLELEQAESAVDELLRAGDALRKQPADVADSDLRGLTRTIALTLGDAYARLERWERVVRFSAPFAYDHGCDPAVLLRLGRAHLALGDPAAARRSLRRVTEDSSEAIRTAAELEIARIDLAENRIEGAIGRLGRAARSADPHVGGSALLLRCETHESRQEFKEAVKCLAEFGRRFGDDPRASAAALKLVDLAAGPLDDPMRAALLLERIIENRPGLVDAVEGTKRLARLRASAGLVDSARKQLEAELEQLTDDDPARAELLELLATILEDALLPARARVAYRRLAVLPGHRIRARLKASRCLLRIAEEAPLPKEQRRELLACLEEVRAVPLEGLDEADRKLRLEIEVECLTQLGDAEAARRVLEEGLR